MAHIALVDHEELFKAHPVDAFQRFGHVVTAFGDSHSALDVLSKNLPDVALFNLTLPGIDGLEMLRRFRQISSLPIIIVSSDEQGTDEVNEVVSFRLGADDYIRTPVSHNILSERVRAVLRRSHAPGPQAAPAAAGAPDPDLPDDAQGIELFDRDFRCRWRARDLIFTRSEYAIVSRLVQANGAAVSRETLTLEIGSDAEAHGDRAIDAHMKRIRKKFLAVDPGFVALKTRRGIGYLFQPQRRERLSGAAARGAP